MKATTSVTALPTSRNSFYNKKRSSPASLNKRKDSPLRDSARRTSPELLAAEVRRQSAAQMVLAERDLQKLLEHEYQSEVKTYMFDMEVSCALLFSTRGRGREADCDVMPSFPLSLASPD